jgi:hypothetical protein
LLKAAAGVCCFAAAAEGDTCCGPRALSVSLPLVLLLSLSLLLLCPLFVHCRCGCLQLSVLLVAAVVAVLPGRVLLVLLLLLLSPAAHCPPSLLVCFCACCCSSGCFCGGFTSSGRGHGPAPWCCLQVSQAVHCLHDCHVEAAETIVQSSGGSVCVLPIQSGYISAATTLASTFHKHVSTFHKKTAQRHRNAAMMHMRRCCSG